MANLKNSLSFENSFSNQDIGGKLWLLWRDGLEISVANYSAQHVSVLLKANSYLTVISVVYAKCNYMERRDL